MSTYTVHGKQRARKIEPGQRQDIRDRYRAGEQVRSIAADYAVTPAAISYHVRGIERRPACGTPAGYQRHKADRQTPCEPCRQARAASERAYYLARKGRA